MCTMAGQVLLAPHDRIGKARAQDFDGSRIGGEHLLHQLFLFEHDGLAVHVFFSVRGRRALVPTCIALGMIANHHDGHIRFARESRGFQRGRIHRHTGP